MFIKFLWKASHYDQYESGSILQLRGFIAPIYSSSADILSLLNAQQTPHGTPVELIHDESQAKVNQPLDSWRPLDS